MGATEPDSPLISRITSDMPGWKFWRRLIREWHRTLVQYTALTEIDLSGWQLERSQVGFLAAAIWRLGNEACALEEYTWSGPRTKEHGRIDLWFQIAGYSVCVEAKKCVLAGPSDIDKVEWALDAAARQIRKRTRKQADLGMALCLAAINVKRSQPNADAFTFQQVGKKMIKRFAPPTHIVGISWLPEECRRQIRHQIKGVERFPFAAALIGRVVRRWT